MDYDKAIIYYLANLLVAVIYSVSMLVYLGRYDTRAPGTRALQRLLIGILSWAFYDLIMSIVGASGFINSETAFFMYRALSIMWLVFGGLAGEQIVSLIRPVTHTVRVILFSPFLAMYFIHLLFPAYTSARVYGIEGGWPVFPGPWQVVYNTMWFVIFIFLAGGLLVSVLREKDIMSRREKSILLAGVLASIAGLGMSRVLLQEIGPGFPALGNASMSLFVMAAFIGIIRYGRVLSHGKLYQATVNSIPGGLAHVKRGRITWTNHVFTSIPGLEGRNPVGMYINDILTPVPETGVSGESGFLARAGDNHYMVETASIDPKDPGQSILYVIIDVTDRERVSEELRKSVEEKEILMRELQHRVKNNLSLVESYIGLGITATTNETVNRVLTETRARVHTISAIYDQLNKSGSVGIIDMRTYLADIAVSLEQTYAESRPRVQLEAVIDPVMIDVKRAVLLGIITNELVTNSFKHAYPGERDGRISIALRDEGDTIILEVTDDGVGFPGAYDVLQTKCLGLKLVDHLSKQIGGSFDIMSRGGTLSRVTFPRNP